MNVDEEGKELEKCMKMIAGRTIEKVYGTAAIMIIPAKLRQAIKERREMYNDRRTLEDLGRYKGAKMSVNRMILQERKRKQLKLITGMKIGKRREVKWFGGLTANRDKGEKGKQCKKRGGVEG